MSLNLVSGQMIFTLIKIIIMLSDLCSWSNAQYNTEKFVHCPIFIFHICTNNSKLDLKRWDEEEKQGKFMDLSSSMKERHCILTTFVIDTTETIFKIHSFCAMVPNTAFSLDNSSFVCRYLRLVSSAF